jgi:hypothetical protein
MKKCLSRFSKGYYYGRRQPPNESVGFEILGAGRPVNSVYNCGVVKVTRTLQVSALLVLLANFIFRLFWSTSAAVQATNDVEASMGLSVSTDIVAKLIIC